MPQTWEQYRAKKGRLVCLIYKQLWNLANRKKVLEMSRRYKPSPKAREAKRLRSQEYRKTSDRYIQTLVLKTRTPMPKELIDAKRELCNLKRYLKCRTAKSLERN